MKEYKVANYTCLVGGNAKENWEILGKAKQKYRFFHLSAFPSCYVILQTEEEVDKDILKECAEICLENTKQKDATGVYVDCTPVKNIRKGDKVGEIYYVSNRKVEKIRV
jgi:predicted ribosome quality control (RQC) complex YloA/Tae2 family protein